MIKRRHIEELRDMLGILKNDSESLYHFGDLCYSKDCFSELLDSDRRRLIYLALSEGDEDTRAVANHLKRSLKPQPRNKEELFAQLDETDRAEIEEYERLFEEIGTTDQCDTVINASVRDRISSVLREGCERIGFLEVEEAFRVLIPPESEEAPIWVGALQENGGFNILLPEQVIYAPEEDRKYDLLSSIRHVLYVLHIHNHPISPGHIGICMASKADCGFADHWKSIRPELANRMLFFVVQANKAVEYTADSPYKSLWIL